MNDTEKLAVLKKDLQMTTNANDVLLQNMLMASKSMIEREGIILEDSIECDMIQIQYAAYIFRKRASSETAMPRFLRYELNNLLFSQKAKGEGT